MIGDLTIVVPIKNPPDFSAFIDGNRKYLEKFPVIVIDAGGGTELIKYAKLYLVNNVNLTEARKVGYSLVQTPFILNLDCDVLIPDGYIESALELFKRNKDIGAISIFYDNLEHCQGALEFGISIWRTEILKNLYDFSFNKVNDGILMRIGPNIFSSLNNGWYECTYMWRKLKDCELKLETLNFRAKHLGVN